MTGGSSNGGAPQGGTSSAGAPQGGSSTGGASSDGASGSGGAGGAGIDAGTDAKRDAAAVDPCATARFCEDFESYPSGAAPGGSWSTQTNLGQVNVVTSQKYRGQKSAQFSTQSSSGSKTAFIRLAAASVFPVPGNVYFGRMMAWLDSAPDQSVHWTFIQGGGLVPGQTYHALYRYGGQHPVTQGGSFVGTQLMANYETPDSYSGNGPSSDCWNHANQTVMPVGRWACVEWQFDGPNDTMRFWLDGAAVDTLTVMGTGEGCGHQPNNYTWTAPTFDRMDLGWESYQQDDARTIWIDDVVLSKTKIGCPQ